MGKRKIPIKFNMYSQNQRWLTFVTNGNTEDYQRWPNFTLTKNA